MSICVGFYHQAIAHRGISPAETLEFARAHGFDGVQFTDPGSIDPGLDPGKLRAFRQAADRLGLYLEVGLPSANPARRARERGAPVSSQEMADELIGLLPAVAALGCRVARISVGDRHDRFRSDVPWHDQVELTLEVFTLLTPRLLDLGMRLAIENQSDFTAGELLELLGRLDSRAFGVTLDTGNLLMRLDDPVAAVAQLAPWVLMTHVKDAILAFTARGLCWQARPVGSGILPLPDLLALLIQAHPDLPLTIEIHPRTYDLPIYERRWLSYFPGLTPQSLATVVRLATLCEFRFAQGLMLRPESTEAIPWANRDQDWLASSLGYLRSVSPTLERL